jgi:hypothetical protein
VAACHTRLAKRLAGPRPGGPIQLWSGPRAHAVCARAGRAGDVVTTCSLREGRCGGALADGLMVASRWQGVVGELVGSTGRAPGKEGAGGAHRGRRSTTRRGGGSVR